MVSVAVVGLSLVTNTTVLASLGDIGVNISQLNPLNGVTKGATAYIDKKGDIRS